MRVSQRIGIRKGWKKPQQKSNGTTTMYSTLLKYSSRGWKIWETREEKSEISLDYPRNTRKVNAPPPRPTSDTKAKVNTPPPGSTSDTKAKVKAEIPVRTAVAAAPVLCTFAADSSPFYTSGRPDRDGASRQDD
jgi:hypothetical protein